MSIGISDSARKLMGDVVKSDNNDITSVII